MGDLSRRKYGWSRVCVRQIFTKLLKGQSLVARQPLSDVPQKGGTFRRVEVKSRAAIQDRNG